MVQLIRNFTSIEPALFNTSPELLELTLGYCLRNYLVLIKTSESREVPIIYITQCSNPRSTRLPHKKNVFLINLSTLVPYCQEVWVMGGSLFPTGCRLMLAISYTTTTPVGDRNYTVFRSAAYFQTLCTSSRRIRAICHSRSVAVKWHIIS